MLAMSSTLQRRLVVVSGKGGVGKTTVSAALGLLGARRGLRTIVVEVTGGEQGDDAGGIGRLAALCGHPRPEHGVETPLRERLWGLSIDRDRVLGEWLRAIGGRVPARVLTSSGSFQYMIAAAPGAREMITMVKLWELAEGRRPADRNTRGGYSADGERAYDLVVFDAPATGHALAMLRSPHTFGSIARVGPIARQAGQVRELLEDPARSAYLAVTHATEMGVTETLELCAALRRELRREADAVIVNGTLPRRFEQSELRQLEALAGAADTAGPADTASAADTAGVADTAGAADAASPADTAGIADTAGAADTAGVAAAAVRAANAVHERVLAQRRQIARLRADLRSGGERTHDGTPPVLSVPFIFHPELDLHALERIADRLARGL